MSFAYPKAIVASDLHIFLNFMHFCLGGHQTGCLPSSAFDSAGGVYVVSLCTTLCLQWEPEIIAVAVMYLTSRLTKFDITDWQGKPSGYRGKWYEFIVEDVTLELLEGMLFVVCGGGLCGLTVAFARNPKGRGFESRPVRFQVTALGKLLTRMCLCHQAV